MYTLTKLKIAKLFSFLDTTSYFSQLGLISDPNIDFQKCWIGLNDYKISKYKLHYSYVWGDILHLPHDVNTSYSEDNEKNYQFVISPRAKGKS